MSFPPGIEQYPGNQKPGENKKQIHPDPAALGNVKTALGRPVIPQSKVAEQHQQDSQPANTVKRRQVPPEMNGIWTFARHIS